MAPSESSLAYAAPPTLLRKGSHDMLSAPLVLDFETIYEGKRGENEEEKQEQADAFSSPDSSPPLTLQSHPSPASTVQTTPDWSSKTTAATSSTAAGPSPAIKKAKSSQAISSRPSANSALSGAIAAQARPLYHDRANSAGSSSTGGSPSQAHRSALRRQLMPAIPTRKESATLTGDGQSSASKNSSNIQSLAQAIAARAQHVAAANAMARAGMYPKSTASTATAKGSKAAAVLVPAAASAAEADTKKAEVIGKDEDKLVDMQTTSVAPEIAAQEPSADAEIAGNSTIKVDPLLDPMEGGPRLAGPRDRSSTTQIRDSVYSNYSQDSYRWSKADWVLADESLSGHGEQKDGTSTEDNDSNGTSNGKFSIAHDSEHSAGTTQTSHYDDKSSATGHDVSRTVTAPGKRGSNQSRASSGSADGFPERTLFAGKASRTGMAGLGIQEGVTNLLSDPAPIVAKASHSAASNGSDHYAMASEGVQSVSHDGPLLSPAMIVSSPPSTTISPRNSGVRRKSKPAALNLNVSPTISMKSPPSTSLARSIASPTLRSKTPPPTLPPAEPLPPIPATPSSVYRKSLTKSIPSSSPKMENGLEQSNPLMAAFAALASAEQEPRKRQGSDPSLTAMSHLRLTSFDDADQSTSLRRRLSSKGASARENSAAKSVAASLVSANHASTLAGVESAQAVLDEVTPEQSYDEKRASFVSTAKADKRAGKHASDPVVSSSRRRSEGGKRISKQKQTSAQDKAAADTQKVGEEASSDAVDRRDNDNEKEGDNDDLEEEDEDEEAEEAVVTRVLSVNGPTTVVPTSQPMLIRKDSIETGAKGAGPASTAASSTSSHGPSAATSSMVARMRAQIEGRNADMAKAGCSTEGTLNSGQTVQTVARKAVDTEEKETMQGAAAPMASQTEVFAATADTPALSLTHSDFGVSSSNNAHSASPVQKRQSSTEEGRNTDSSGHALAAQMKSSAGFDEVALAFKQLQAEKKMLERVIRATTPLSGIGDSQDLSRYLTSMANKLDLSTAEIRRLLDLLDQQRSVMDYMVETHQLELDAYVQEVDELNEDIEDVTMEADTHRANCIRLTEDLDRAHAEVIAARAETLRYRSLLSEEEGKRERYAELLRRAREDVSKMQREKDDALRMAGHQPEYRRGRDSPGDSGSLRVDSPSSDRMSPLLRPRTSRTNLAPTGWVQTSETGKGGGGGDDWQTEKAMLLAELKESRKNQLESDRLLQDYKSMNQGKSHEELSTGSLSPLITGPSEVEEALRDKLVQQEKDIAELRAAVALGGASGGAGEEKLASLPAGRANQVQTLMADLADKRAREAQIRTAYKQLRDDMRKMQLAQQQDRKRSQASLNYLARSTSPVSPHGHGGTGGGSSNQSTPTGGPPTAWQGMGLPSDPATPASPVTSRQLKRLSLPLVSKQLGGLTLGSDLTNGSSSSTNGHLSATTLHRTGSRTYSNDGHSPLNMKRTSWLGRKVSGGGGGDDDSIHGENNSLGSQMDHAPSTEQVESLK